MRGLEGTPPPCPQRRKHCKRLVREVSRRHRGLLLSPDHGGARTPDDISRGAASSMTVVLRPDASSRRLLPHLDQQRAPGAGVTFDGSMSSEVPKKSRTCGHAD